MVPFVEVTGSDRLTDPDLHAAGGSRTGPPACAAVGDLVRGLEQPHRRPEVGQAVGGTSDGHRTEPGGVQGEEPDPPSTFMVINIGADVGLAEGRRPRCSVSGGCRDPHEKRHQTDPGRPVVGVDQQPPRQEALYHSRIKRPVHEGQPLPALPHDRSVHREGARPAKPGCPLPGMWVIAGHLPMMHHGRPRPGAPTAAGSIFLRLQPPAARRNRPTVVNSALGVPPPSRTCPRPWTRSAPA